MQVTFAVSSLLLAVVAVSAYPASLNPESRAAILVQDSAPNADGSFKNNFQTENGIKQESVGYLKAGPEGPVAVFQGASAYVAPDGQTIQTGYIADENGYQPYGAHLPTPPPIPAEIQESLICPLHHQSHMRSKSRSDTSPLCPAPPNQNTSKTVTTLQ